MITSNFGQIGNIRWINTNQEYVLDVMDEATDELLQTLPAWWGSCWWIGYEPDAHLNMITTVIAMLTEDNDASN